MNLNGSPDRLNLDSSDEPDENAKAKASEFFVEVGKPKFVQDVFDRIASRYDLLNSVTSFGLHKRWRSCALKMTELKKSGTALDIACGTGDFLFGLREMVGSGGSVIGLDFSRKMLDIAQLKLSRKNVNATLVHGDAERLPFESESFDAVTIGFALRNLANIETCFSEMNRVLKPGGRLVALEIARPVWWPYRSLFLFYFEKLLPWLAVMFRGEKQAYRWLPASLAAFYSRDGVASLMGNAGFSGISTRDLALGAVCIYVGVKR